MILTLEILKEKKACETGIAWFKDNFKSGKADIKDVIKKLEDIKDPDNYLYWLFSELKVSGQYKLWHETGQFNGGFYTQRRQTIWSI